MSDEAKKREPHDAKGGKNRKPSRTKARLIAAALALGGMIVGSLVGIAVQIGVESTGVLGPSVESLIAEQESNFNQMGTRIEALRRMAPNPEMTKSLNELRKLLARQGELQLRSNRELAHLGGQVASLREQALEDRGFAGGADFWLDTGESVSVGDSHHVLGVVRTWANAVDVKPEWPEVAAHGRRLGQCSDGRRRLHGVRQAGPAQGGRPSRLRRVLRLVCSPRVAPERITRVEGLEV